MSNLAYKTIYATHNTQVVIYKKKATRAEIRIKKAIKKQRLAGFSIVLFALVIPFICGDATGSIFFLSVGIPLLFSRKVL